MEETRKKFPSLPPNYVSLQQLREQRLREQDQRQKEKEEEERKQEEQKPKEEEEHERRKKEKEERKLRESRKNPGIRDKTSSIRIDRKDRGKVPGGCDRKKEEEETDSKLKSPESEIVVAVEGGNTDFEQKCEEVKKKPKKKRYSKKTWKSKESKTDDAGNGDLNELPPSESGRNEVILKPSSVAKKQAAVSPEKAKETNPTAEIVGGIAVLSVADDQKAAETDGDKRANGNRSAATVKPGFRSNRRKSSVKQTAEVAQRTENPTAEMVGRIAVLSVANDHKAVETDGEKGINGNRSVATANRGFRSSRRKSSVTQTAEVERWTENPTVAGDLKVVETGGEKEVNGSDSTVAMNALNGGGRREEYWSTGRFGRGGNTIDANLVWVKKRVSDDKNTKKPIGLRSSGSRRVDIRTV